MAVRYYEAGIPECYWFREADNQDKLKSLIELLDSGDWIIALCNNVLTGQDYIAWALKSFHRASYVDFSELAFSLTDFFKTHSVMSAQAEVIGIVNVRPSLIFDKTCDSFVTYLANLFSSARKKKIVIGLEKRNDMSEYKTLSRFIIDKQHFKIVEI